MPERVEATVTLRPATEADSRRVWEWRNDPTTREASFNTSYICYADHERWFSSKLSASDTRIFIVLDARGREVGYVRFNIVARCAEISVTIDEGQRGRGYGPSAIQQSSDYLLSATPVQRVIALVKRSNAASVAAFERAGFVISDVKEVAGAEAYEMVYQGAVASTRECQVNPDNGGALPR